MPRAARHIDVPVALATILASAAIAVASTDLAQAARGGGGGGGGFHGGGGGGFHAGGGGFHGGGGGFHGGGGGFHAGGGGFHAGGGGFRAGGGGFRAGGGFHPGGGFHAGGFHGGGGFRGGGFHAVHAAPGGGGHFQSHSARSFTGSPVHTGSLGRAGVVAGNHVFSNHVMQRNALAVGHALSSRQVASALHAHGGLHNPMTRAAITTAVAGAAWGHHHGGWWWRHPHGGFGWVGPVFWPYAYYDFYDYTWWGWGYDPYFWDYGYGDLYTGLFSPYDYGGLSGYAAYLPGHAGPAAQAPATAATEQSTSLADMCGSDNKDIAGFPVEQFRTAIQPNSEQSAALDELANASQKAAETIRNSCPKDVALTTPNRLAAMQQRVEAMRDAVSIVQPALDKFYGLLSDEQKARITALAAEQRPAQRKDSQTSEDCTAAQPNAVDWPGELIERNVKPTDAQRASLAELQNAATKAADILKSSCPPQDALTPPARLTAVSARLDAMLQAIGTIRPALDNFYNGLSDEQKAAFDAIGPERNGTNTPTAERDERPRHAHHRRHYYSIGGMIFRMMRL